MIVRVKRHREQPFVVLDRQVLRLITLSFKARGLWAHCMTYPDDWTLNLKHLASQSASDGLTALRSAFKELEAEGLASLETTQADNGAMRGKRWVVYEVPDLNPHRDAGFADIEKSPTLESTDDEANRTSADHTLRSKHAAGSKEDVRKKEQQQAAPRVESSGDGAATPLKDLLPATFPEDTGRDAATQLLMARGVDEPVARRLSEQYEAERIVALVQRFDAERNAGKSYSPGWLVAAIRNGYTVHLPAGHQEQLLTFGQARDAYERLTGGDPTRPFDRYFESVKTSRGTRFKKKQTARFAPSHQQ